MPERAKKRPSDDRDLTSRLWAALGNHDLPGIRAVVSGGVARLSGTVNSKSMVAEAIGVARSVDGIKSVKSDLQIATPDERAQNAPTYRIMPNDPSDLLSFVDSDDAEPEVMVDQRDDVSLALAEDLLTLPSGDVVGTEIEFNNDLGTSDPAEAVENGEPYFAPTDPVVRPISRTAGDIRFVGGFARDSLDPSVEEAVDGGVDEPDRLQLGDSEIAEDVRMALEEDSATADLSISVIVRDGVVILRGEVPTIDDVEFAEEVASRVPGVVEVREELEIESH